MYVWCLIDLDIEKRKIYDLINIFSSFHLIRKVGKGNYVWNGVKSMEMKLKEVTICP